MIRFFRINDPFRILFILLLLLLARLPYYVLGVELTVEELNWLLVGEKLQNGGTLYQDVWTDIGPFAGGVYAALYWLFGKSVVPYYFVSVGLVIYQAFLFNTFLNDDEAYNEKTYLPALFFALLMCLDFTFVSLPPALMAMPFLLLVLRNTIRSDDPKDQENEFFKTGLYLGIASLFYFPSIVFIPLAVFLFLLFRSFELRSFLIYLFGVSMALVWPLLYFSFFGSATEAVRQYFNFRLSVPNFADTINGLWLLVLPSVWLVLSFLRLLPERRFVNFQVNVQRIVVIWFFGSVAALFFAKNGASFQVMIFVPVFAFFTAHYFLLIRRKKFLDLLFMLWLVGIIGFGYNAYWSGSEETDFVDYEPHLLQKEGLVPFSGKKVWYIGSRLELYQTNQLASPYLHWGLAQKHLANLQDDLLLIELSGQLQKDIPDIIVDPAGFIPKLAKRIGWIEESYARQPGTHYYHFNADKK